MALILPFLLALVGAVVDFGMAFFIGQVTQYAARDAARFAATIPPVSFTSADPEFPSGQLASCTLPCPGSPSLILQAVSSRMPALGVFGGFTATASLVEVGDQEAVTVQISGDYEWLMLGIIRAPTLPLLGDKTFPASVTITRSTTARWEWQS